MLLLQELFAQPLSDRFVIKFQAEESHNDAADVDCQCYRPDFEERIEFVVDQPGVEQVHDRVVDGVERVGYVAQELAYLRRTFVRSLAGSSEPDKDREDKDDAGCFELASAII